MKKIKIYKNTYDEYATYHHGSDVLIWFGAGTYTINEEN